MPDGSSPGCHFEHRVPFSCKTRFGPLLRLSRSFDYPEESKKSLELGDFQAIFVLVRYTLHNPAIRQILSMRVVKAILHNLLHLIFRTRVGPIKAIFGAISGLDHGQNRHKLLEHRVLTAYPNII